MTAGYIGHTSLSPIGVHVSFRYLHCGCVGCCLISVKRCHAFSLASFYVDNKMNRLPIDFRSTFFRKSYACPSVLCEVRMTDHIRRFVHGQGCINVLLKKLEDASMSGDGVSILMWSWCRRCKQVGSRSHVTHCRQSLQCIFPITQTGSVSPLLKAHLLTFADCIIFRKVTMLLSTNFWIDVRGVICIPDFICYFFTLAFT